MVSIKVVNYEKQICDSRLELNMDGVDPTIVNTFRRIITTNIPIYVFNKILISKNTSIFNNNYLKLRIKNLPVIGIKSDKSIFEKKKIKENEEEDEDDIIVDNLDMNIDENLNSSSLQQLTMYIDIKNSSKDIKTITTDDVNFYLSKKKIKSPYTNKIQLLKLQPEQEIKMTCITELNIEDHDSIYSPVSVCFFKKNKDNNYDFVLESRGQLTEFEILQKMFDNIYEMLKSFYDIVPDINDKEGKFSVPDFDHTLGNIISTGLQNHKDVSFAGYNMPHPLDPRIIIHYKISNGKIKDIIKQVINEFNKKIQLIEKSVSKLS